MDGMKKILEGLMGHKDEYHPNTENIQNRVKTILNSASIFEGQQPDSVGTITWALSLPLKFDLAFPLVSSYCS